MFINLTAVSYTHLTTNLTLDSLQNPLDTAHARIYDRLLEMCAPIPVSYTHLKSTDDQIIGHFGLGFYSAFMVADEVEIDTLSYKEGATPVHWTCDGGTDYELTDGTKTTIGTQITLHLNEDCLEFANEYRAREVIEKYCSFMPTEIYLSKANAEPEYETCLLYTSCRRRSTIMSRQKVPLQVRD